MIALRTVLLREKPNRFDILFFLDTRDCFPPVLPHLGLGIVVYHQNPFSSKVFLTPDDFFFPFPTSFARKKTPPFFLLSCGAMCHFLPPQAVAACPHLLSIPPRYSKFGQNSFPRALSSISTNTSSDALHFFSFRFRREVSLEPFRPLFFALDNMDSPRFGHLPVSNDLTVFFHKPSPPIVEGNCRYLSFLRYLAKVFAFPGCPSLH